MRKAKNTKVFKTFVFSEERLHAQKKNFAFYKKPKLQTFVIKSQRF
jgi:hypothetical protein